MQREFPTGWTLLIITALALSQLNQSSPVFAAEGDSDIPISLEQCRDQLLSNKFGVFDIQKDKRIMPGVARQFAKVIEEIIDRKGSNDFEKAKDRFDRARANLLERIIDGRWSMNDASDDILTDCFFAVHPDADVEN